jgi:hypothetical protein
MLQADQTGAGEVEAAHPVGIAICIFLTLAFGVWCLCASRLTNLPPVDAYHLSTNQYPNAHAVTPQGGE